ncbi:sigma factor [Streptomyces sp. NPDC057362]|uniref:sigma factor n=1 Tax=Streptomyces sp. NPDC057362 TaxID=3346106 RepID=UPI00362FADC3
MSAPSMETTTAGVPEPRWSHQDHLDLALDIFLAQRTRLFRIAHQILGDVARAEDAVQETWLRWQRADRGRIENPAAFLTTTTTRLALNVIQSARHRHEIPSESQLVNLVDLTVQDPVLRAEQTVSIEEALALLMARLTPDGLAAYVLRKGFGYGYADLAELLRISVTNARQLVRRAQTRLVKVGRQRPVPAEAHRRLVDAFQIAANTGDLESLTRVLVPQGQSQSSSSPAPGLSRQILRSARHAA